MVARETGWLLQLPPETPLKSLISKTRTLFDVILTRQSRGLKSRRFGIVLRMSGTRAVKSIDLIGPRYKHTTYLDDWKN